jgi:hypothetical protein
VYRPDVVPILGQFNVKVVWKDGKSFTAADGDDVYGQYLEDTNTVQIASGCSDPIDALLHELWHAYARRMGQDDPKEDDAAARRVLTFLGDLVLNQWELVKEFRKEKLKLWGG